jgi:ACS family hexuronate transporter-like MFS transporter
LRTRIPVRWIAITIFTFTSVLNYLDRFILATMVDIWRSRPEFPFNYSDYGAILSVFGIAYAVSAPFMGYFLDRVGLNAGISISVALWSFISMGHGLIRSFEGLMLWRSALGVVEASGISAAGKANAIYLQPEERAVGAAMSQLGLSIGAAIAPGFTVYFAYHHNWRWAFFSAGLLGLLWIPLWWATSKTIAPSIEAPPNRAAVQISGMLTDRRIWGLMAANALSMTFYTLWTNWAPTYLVRTYHLTPEQASHYSWVVPIGGYIGAFLGGSLSWRMITRSGMDPISARKRVCFLAAWVLTLSALIPLLPTPALASAGMALSFFCISGWSTNLYTLPIDIFGAGRAAFAVSSMVFAYGAMQAIVSKPLGSIIEVFGFQPVLICFAFLPAIAYVVLNATVRSGDIKGTVCPITKTPAGATSSNPQS